MVRKLDEAIPALLIEGGALVRCSACSPTELAKARDEGRAFVDKNGFGVVLRYREWRQHAERALGNVPELPPVGAAASAVADLDDTDEFVPLLPAGA